MGHLSSINGCGVRSCDSLWEKRTNVSRDICLSVRAEEVSLPKRFGRIEPVFFFFLGEEVWLLHPCACKHLLSWMKIQMELIQDPRLEAVSDLTLKQIVSLFDAVQNSLVFVFIFGKHVAFSSASLTTVCSCLS